MAAKRRTKRTKITTLGGLATLFVEEPGDFREDVNKRFDQMDKRFDRIEQRLGDAEKRISALEMKVTGLYRLVEEQKTHRLDVTRPAERIAHLEQKVFGE